MIVKWLKILKNNLKALIERTVSVHEFVVDWHDEVEGVGPHHDQGHTSGQEQLGRQRRRIHQVSAAGSQEANDAKSSLKNRFFMKL